MARRIAEDNRSPPNSSWPPLPPPPFPREAAAAAAVGYCADDLGCTGELERVGEGRSTSASADAEETSPEVVGRDSALDSKNVEGPVLLLASLQSSMTESRRDWGRDSEPYSWSWAGSRDDVASSYGPSAPAKGRLRGLTAAGEELMAEEAVAGEGSILGGEKKNGEESFPPGEDGSGSKALEKEAPKSVLAGRP